MDPGQPSSTPPQPRRRRWFQDLKQILLKPFDSGSSHAPSSPLQATLQDLRKSAELVSPLRPAIDGLTSFVSLFETATKHRQEYQKMAEDLNITLQFLARHLDASGSTQMTETITEVLWAIQEEVGFAQAQEDRGTVGRLLGADYDEEDLVRRYRRIEQLFHRLQLEVSMGAWHTENANQMEEKLSSLRPAKLATFNSILSAQINRRTCTENTRKNLLYELNTWSDKPEGEKMFWMDGMAGTGKTTIACTLSESLYLRGQLAASFFCTQTSPECRDANRIIPTIAYQLARHSTPFMSALGQALEENPDMGSLNISAQFQQMLKDPLSTVKDKVPNNLVVVVDALDECEDKQVIGQILEAAFRFAKDLPIKFFITSRPEAAIREKMFSPENVSKSILHLHEIEASLVQEDIELYLREELKSMSPSRADVKQIATLANNSFIYAATAARYIRPGRSSTGPHRRLARVLAVDSESGGEFNHIDSLYSTVLNTALEELEPEVKGLTQLVLRAVVCAQEPIRIDTLAALCGLPDEGLALAALRPLRSVLHVSGHTNVVLTLHTSFPDYIFTQHRSGRFFCDKSAHSQLLARRCFEVMKGQLRFNICHLPSSLIPDDKVPNLKTRIKENISPSLSYACRYWTEHLENSPASGDLFRMLDEFLSQRLLFWMEVLNLKKCIVIGTQGLAQVREWVRVSESRKYKQRLHPDGNSQAANGPSDTLQLTSDAHKFLARFSSHAISLSTPHIYISALPFCPPSSLVSVHYRQRAKGLMQVNGTAIIRLGLSALATWRTGSHIFSVAYSPDGAHVASGNWNGAICIRNVHDNKVVVGPFTGNSQIVYSIAFSPDGTRLASASGNNYSSEGSVYVWDARDGTPIAGPLKGHTNCVNSVAFSPNGVHIVSGSSDHTIRVWDAPGGTLAAGPFKGHTGRVNSVGYSPDGARIVSGSSDHTIRLWDANTGISIRLFEGHTDRVLSVGFSPHGQHIVSGSRDCTIRVWNVDDGALSICPLEGHTKSITSVAYSPNGKLIVSGSKDQTIRVWNVPDGTLATGPFEGHSGCVNSVGFSPDGAQIVSGSYDQSIRIWNVSDNLPAPPPPKGTSSHINSAEFSPDGTLIATGSSNATVGVWSAVDGTLIAGPLRGHTDYVLSVAFSPDSTRIASGSQDQTIRIWHARSGTLVAGPFEGHSSFVKSVAFSPDGLRLASGSYDNTVRVWDPSNGRLVAGPFEGHTCWIESVAFSPDGTLIASGSRDKTIRVWNSFAGNQIAHPFEGHNNAASCVCFSHDGSRIVSGSWDNTVCIWNARNGQIIAGPFKSYTYSVSSIALSPDSTLIVIGSSNNTCTIGLLNTADGTPAAPLLRGHTDAVRAASFSRDGLSILSCSFDETVRVWDVQRKQSTCVALRDPWEVYGDGWVLNSHSQILFWVPAEIRNYFSRLNNPVTIGPLGTVNIDFDGILLGSEWAGCWHDS
ncbi:Vegetative incompatibility protein HET-E-1 [Ceratobasidium theobromae]|uniref:Vegetative incompatibility protein HET-E-1 n=1 Tax=Ceratobasidium theobromae TaxID=1582974 RepID=A0A5N5QPF0_9AGAM|nr:Vegetative incompatibility protein HET-E-1 [Ceratobasidium theobromae]